jgi:hypothetical protein
MDLNFRGTYDSTQSYVAKDVVSYTQNGITKFFLCITSNDSVSPKTPSMTSDTNTWCIINTQSNFPNSIDMFIQRANILGQDKADIVRINELTLKTSITTNEQYELDNLIAKHRDKLFLADDLNALQESLSNLQLFFKDRVDSKLDQNINEIETVKDNALNALDTKKASLDLYLDSTTAGALRTDLGVMSDLTTFDKSSLVKALNETITVSTYIKHAINLNTDVQFKEYYINPNTPNSPTTNAAVCYVNGDGNFVSQMVIDLINGDLYTRIKSSGVWQSWALRPKSINVVPYSGATQNIDLNGKNINNVSGLSFNDKNADGISFELREDFSNTGAWQIRKYVNGNFTSVPFSITKDGIITNSTQPYFYASTGTDKVISSGVDTKITLSASGDDYGEFVNGIWRPKETGVYLISIYVRWLSVVNGVTTLKLYSSGSVALNMDLGHNTKVAGFARPTKLTAGVPYEIYVAQDSGVSATIDTMFMYITKLS